MLFLNLKRLWLDLAKGLVDRVWVQDRLDSFGLEMGHSKQITKLMILLTLFIVRLIDMTHMLIVYLFLLFNKNKRTNKQRHSNRKAKIRLILGLPVFHRSKNY